MKKIKNVKKTLNKLTKLTNFIKPNEKFPSKVTVLICITMFEGYIALHERFFYCCHVKTIN